MASTLNTSLALVLLLSSSATGFSPSVIHGGRGVVIPARSFAASPAVGKSACQSPITAPTLRLYERIEEEEEEVADYNLKCGNISNNDTCNVITRRALLHSTLAASGAGASALVLGGRPSPAHAAAATAADTQQSSLASTTSAKNASGSGSAIVSNTLCDPSVSTWVKTTTTSSNNNEEEMRTIHILGTAHISSASAELAGSMVRELKPNVVFVELDAKRVSRAIPGAANNNNGAASTDGATGANDGRNTANQVQNNNDNDGVVSTSSASAATESTANNASPFASATTGSITSTPTNVPGAGEEIKTKRFNNPFDIQSKLVNVGSKYVGNAVKGMYGKLESEGFKAGDEFAMSVREGLAIGSTIVLGDRDVEVTLRRLTQALAKTDLRKLLSSDSEVEKSMESLLPENMKKQLEQQQMQQQQQGNGSITSMGMDSSLAIDKQEFNNFVETMKAKENVKKIMNALKSTAPEIYEAMVAERDVYMARGLDELDVSLNANNASGSVKSAATTVAVMGMAHVDGVERYLASKGWKEMKYPCPAIGGI